jgi:hypothetical protein
MKKLTILMVLFTIGFAGSTCFAQKDTLKISWGITIAPQAKLNPKNISEGFKPIGNLFPQITMVKGKAYAVGFYSINFNNFGMAVGYNPSPDITCYIVGLKSTMTSYKYTGVGIGTPLAGGRSIAFIEIGTGLKKWEPAIYTGMFIPFQKIKLPKKKH